MKYSLILLAFLSACGKDIRSPMERCIDSVGYEERNAETLEWCKNNSKEFNNEDYN